MLPTLHGQVSDPIDIHGETTPLLKDDHTILIENNIVFLYDPYIVVDV